MKKLLIIIFLSTFTSLGNATAQIQKFYVKEYKERRYDFKLNAWTNWEGPYDNHTFEEFEYNKYWGGIRTIFEVGFSKSMIIINYSRSSAGSCFFSHKYRNLEFMGNSSKDSNDKDIRPCKVVYNNTSYIGSDCESHEGREYICNGTVSTELPLTSIGNFKLFLKTDTFEEVYELISEFEVANEIRRLENRERRNETNKSIINSIGIILNQRKKN